MNWRFFRPFPWLDTRAAFVAGTPRVAALLDLGSSDGETLGHIAELRPDLRLFAADFVGQPERYPPGCAFARVDLEKQPLPWADGGMDAITCMHLVEHLHDLTLLFCEVARLLKPGGRVYFETPHPKSLTLPSLRNNAPDAGTRPDRNCEFTLSFHDDPTHVAVVPVEKLAEESRAAGLEICGSGISRNWLFAALHPALRFLPPCRQKYTAQVHWLGWSAWLTARRPESAHLL